MKPVKRTPAHQLIDLGLISLATLSWEQARNDSSEIDFKMVLLKIFNNFLELFQGSKSYGKQQTVGDYENLN